MRASYCKTITPQEAAKKLRSSGMSITDETLRKGLLDKVFPFGIAVKTEKSCVCWVFPRKLEDWIAENLEAEG